MSPSRQQTPLHLECVGVLQKYSKRIRRWQPRFLKCSRSMLQYYKYKGAPPSNDAIPDSVLDLHEIARVVKNRETLVFELVKANNERVLTLKASCEPEFKMWIDVITAKVEYLLERVDEDEMEESELAFQTNTFTMLALMSSEEIEALANDSLNETFGAAAEEGTIEASLIASQSVLSVMEDLAENYVTEIGLARGQPNERKTISACERLSEQYYFGIQNRLVLEMTSALGSSLSVDQLIDQPLSTSMAIFSFLDRVDQFGEKIDQTLRPFAAFRSSYSSSSALSRILETRLKSFLPDVETTLVSAVVSISIRDTEEVWGKEANRISRWFGFSTSSSSTVLSDISKTLLRRPPPSGESSPKLSSVFDTIAKLMGHITIEGDESKTAYLRNKAFTSSILYIAGHFQSLKVKVENRSDEKLVMALLKDLGASPDRIAHLQTRWGNESISPEIADVFLTSATRFMVEAAGLLQDYFLQTDEQLPKLFNLLFVHPAWVKGEVSSTLIGKFKIFLESNLEDLPSMVQEKFEARLLRAFLVLYLRKFLVIRPERRLDADGVVQFLMDENLIREWIEFGKWVKREARLDQLWILKYIRIFLLMPPEDILSNFSDAWGLINPSLAFSLYDLLRYCLKLRTDVPFSVYKKGLASCAEYIQQQHDMEGVGIPPPVTSATDILVELFPQAGEFHITGKPWKLEGWDDTSMVLSVASMVVNNTEKLRRSSRSKVPSFKAVGRGNAAGNEMIIPVQSEQEPDKLPTTLTATTRRFSLSKMAQCLSSPSKGGKLKEQPSFSSPSGKEMEEGDEEKENDGADTGTPSSAEQEGEACDVPPVTHRAPLGEVDSQEGQQGEIDSAGDEGGRKASTSSARQGESEAEEKDLEESGGASSVASLVLVEQRQQQEEGDQEASTSVAEGNGGLNISTNGASSTGGRNIVDILLDEANAETEEQETPVAVEAACIPRQKQRKEKVVTDPAASKKAGQAVPIPSSPPTDTPPSSSTTAASPTASPDGLSVTTEGGEQQDGGAFSPAPSSLDSPTKKAKRFSISKWSPLKRVSFSSPKKGGAKSPSVTVDSAAEGEEEEVKGSPSREVASSPTKDTADSNSFADDDEDDDMGFGGSGSKKVAVLAFSSPRPPVKEEQQQQKPSAAAIFKSTTKPTGSGLSADTVPNNPFWGEEEDDDQVSAAAGRLGGGKTVATGPVGGSGSRVAQQQQQPSQQRRTFGGACTSVSIGGGMPHHHQQQQQQPPPLPKQEETRRTFGGGSTGGGSTGPPCPPVPPASSGDKGKRRSLASRW